RLVVEFNGSAWADDALLRLMQLNFAQGDLPGVVRTAERLASDYPQSEVIPEAATWAARVYFRQQDNANGCRWLADGLARVDSLNVELKNQLTFLNGRCGQPATPAPRDTAPPAPASPQTPVRDTTPSQPAAPAPATTWSVQVASSSTQVLANDLVARLARDGFPGAHVEREGAAFKVRLGNFTTRSDVDAYLARVRAKYPQAFVVEVRP
ncbi:MAG TPA: SPOR domain-containing protein, partial [Gemmatimonadales bacterium]|nr:SPOR domain-containing protein [Gemmatimonadales bacterium]